ncbi:MAG: hypothetical protein Q4G19_01795, partial [Clostridia bacterium]|nr:hypothetical protein [Clostridia bacterium]
MRSFTSHILWKILLMFAAIVLICGLLPPEAKAAGGVTNGGSIYDNEAGACLQIEKNSSSTSNKYVLTGFTSSNTAVIPEDSVSLVYVTNDSTKSDSYWGVEIFPNPVTKDTTVTLTVSYTKDGKKQSDKTFKITVKKSAGVSSTVQFRIVNGTWKKEYTVNGEKISALNVSEDGTTITFTTYPDTISNKSGMYYFNCSRTHDAIINNTNCLSMEKVLLAILGDKSATEKPADYIEPDTGYHVEFAYQDWTVDSGSAIDWNLKDLYNGNTKTGRSQLQAIISKGIHTFDDNGHTSSSDGNGFRADTIYTLTLLKEPYSDDKRTDYTVNYYYQGTTDKVFDSKTVTGKQAGTSYEEVAPAKEGYAPDEAIKDITLVLDKTKNIITFYYDKQITINYQSEDESKGTVERDSETLGEVNGTADGSAAEAESGYHFVCWKDEGGTTVSEDAVFKPVKKNGKNVAATYTAYFEEDIVEIQYKTEDSSMGSVNPGSEEVAVFTGTAKGSTAAAKPGYHFVNWTDGTGTSVGNEPKFVPSKTDGRNVAAVYTAHFAENDPVTIKYVALEGGSVDNDQDKDIAPATGEPEGSTATAETSDGYKFSGWYADEDCTILLSEEAKFVPVKDATDKVYKAATYYAYFTRAAIELSKTSELPDGKTEAAAGDIITYTITVENIGNQTVKDIIVSDTMGRDGASVKLATGYSWTITSLAPGASKEIIATYEVTEADVTNGYVKNEATVSQAKDPNNDPLPDGNIYDDDAKTDDPTDKAESKLKVT